MAGIPAAGTSPATCAGIYAINLAWAAEKAKAGGRANRDRADQPSRHAGLFPQHQRPGRRRHRRGRQDRLALLFDIYHTQTTEGDLTSRMKALLPVIGHMQLADVPARNEPGTGEIGWAYVFQQIDALGYTGWVGCEYRPAGETVAGLGWRTRFTG